MADVFEDRIELIPHRRRLFELIEATPGMDWLLLTKRPMNVPRLAAWGDIWPANVWLGTTVEMQKRADELLPHLAAIPAQVKFISAEPLLSDLSIERYLGSAINWVIAGGESGPKARPASPSWFRSLREQCMRQRVPFHFKQWGDWAPENPAMLDLARRLRIAHAEDGTGMIKVGKKLAGRTLDGEEWDGLPGMMAA